LPDPACASVFKKHLVRKEFSIRLPPLGFCGYYGRNQVVAYIETGNVVIGFRKQNKRRSLGPLFEGAGTAIAVTGGVSCVKDGTPSEPPYGGPPPSKREARPQMYSLLHKADSHNR